MNMEVNGDRREETYLARATRYGHTVSEDSDVQTSGRPGVLRAHDRVAGKRVGAENPAFDSLKSRLRLAGFDPAETGRRAVRRASTPSLARTPIAPKHWPLSGIFGVRREKKRPQRSRWQ